MLFSLSSVYTFAAPTGYGYSSALNTKTPERAAPSDIVNFEDENLKWDVNRRLGKGDLTSDITVGEMRNLVDFAPFTTANYKNSSGTGTYYTSLEGLQYATSLKELAIWAYAPGPILAPIEYLGEYLDPNHQIAGSSTGIQSFTFKGYKGNRAICLNLDGKGGDPFFRNVSELSYLKLMANSISSVEDLQDATKLTTLGLFGEYLTADFTPISGKANLESLSLEVSPVFWKEPERFLTQEKINTLKDLDGLKTLYLFNCGKFAALPDMGEFPNLETLKLGLMPTLTDLSPLEGKAQNIKTVELAVTGVKDISALSGRNALQEFKTKLKNGFGLGSYGDFTGSLITASDLEGLFPAPGLTTLDLVGSKVYDGARANKLALPANTNIGDQTGSDYWYGYQRVKDLYLNPAKVRSTTFSLASDVIGEGGGIELLALKGLNGALPSATFEEGDSYGASSKAVVNADGTITLSSRPNNNKLRVKFDGKDGTVTNISKLTGLYYIDTSNIGDSAVPSELSAIAPDSKTFTGKAGKQATVYLLDGTGNPVKDKEGKDITATANDAGEFTMNLPENLTLGQKFNLKAKEPSSFESGMVEVAVAEKQTSKVPTIVQELGEIKGVAGPNAEVVLVDKDGTPIKDGGKEVKTIADADGHYVIDLPAGVKDGDVVGVIATEKDKKPANSETITLDRTNAAITPIADQNGITNVALTPIPVIVDDEKAAVEVTGLPKGVTYNPDTKQIEGTPEVAGNFDVTVKATDEAGNVATETFKLAVKEQETSTTPTIKQDGDQVKGVAGPNAEVVLVDKDGAPIKDGDKVVKVTADADGNYVIDLPAGVKDGDVVGVAATEKDKKPANSATITIDRVAPEAPQVDPIKGGDTTITGKAEPDSIVTIVDKDGNVQGVGKADKDGNFTIEVPEVSEGDKVFVTATDQNGNESKPTEAIVDGVAPEAPQVNPIKGGDTTITGKAEPDSTVIIKGEDGKVLGEGKADKDGNFTIQVPAVSEGDKVFVTATDQNGNESKPTEAIVDGVAPAAPIVNPVKDGDTTVTGKAEPDSTVTVTDKDGNVVGEGKTDKDGNFTVTIPPAKGGDKLFVTATDKNGNVSGKATVEVASGAAGTVVKVKTTKTGDLFNMMPIFILMLIAAMGIFITTVMMRRARQK